MGTGRRHSLGRSIRRWRAAWALGAVAVALLSGCGKTAHDSASEGDGGAGAGAPYASSGGRLDSTGEAGGPNGTAGTTIGTAAGAATSGGVAATERPPEADPAIIGKPLGSEPATLQPADCPDKLENECETDLGDGRSQLVVLPASLSAFDASADQQVFATCRTVYVQPRGGCARPLGVTEGTVHGLAILRDLYVVVQAESILVVNANGIIQAAWRSSSAPSAVVSGGAIDLFARSVLFELDPTTAAVRRLGRNPTEDAGELLAVDDDLVWRVGARGPSDFPSFTPTGMERFVRTSGEITRESDLPCDAIGTDGARVYCSLRDRFERWLRNQSPETYPLDPDSGKLLVGPDLLARGTSIYRVEDPATVVLTLEQRARPFRIATSGVFYQKGREDDDRVWLYRATAP